MRYTVFEGVYGGWNSIKFVLHPDEFENIFSHIQFSFVMCKPRIEGKYELIERFGVFNAYKKYYDKICSRDDCAKELGCKITETLRVSIANYREEEKVKYFCIDEPVIYMSPFSFFLNSKGKLDINSSNYKYNIGIELHYPKIIIPFSENHGVIYQKTNEFAVKKLYDELALSVKSISKKAKVAGIDKIYKPNIWVSDNARQDINSNFYINKNSLIFI